MEPIKVALIGLDTSHSVTFPKLMQDPATPEAERIPELRAVRCLRFETPFQNRKGLDERQAYLESIGVAVTEDFDEAVAECDALLLEINDPSLHLEYFRRAAGLGKPVFLDKPFADTLDHSLEILRIAQENRTRFFTASALRFDADLEQALAAGVRPESAAVWGPLGMAPSGSSLVWYGVHAFEMLQRIMGRGAAMVEMLDGRRGCLGVVSYPDGRRATVELCRGAYQYGAVIRDLKNRAVLAEVTERVPFYAMLLRQIVRFIREGAQPVDHADSLEVMALLDAAERSLASGRAAAVCLQ